MNNFYEPELILSVFVAEFYLIHGLSDEMKTQTTGPHIFERPPL